MKKIVILSGFILGIYANNIDSDLDGVVDNKDKCPNTPFLQIVDLNGCSEEQLNKIQTTLIVGYEYDKTDGYFDSDLIFTSISNRYKNYYFNYFYSQIDSNSNDSIISLYYKYRIRKINLKMGIKYYMSTDYNLKADYAFKVKGSTFDKNYNYSLSLKYKVYGENGTSPKETITMDMSKSINKWYLSSYFYTENSIYNSKSWSNYIGLYTQYSINNKLFTSFDVSTNVENINIITIIASLGYEL